MMSEPNRQRLTLISVLSIALVGFGWNAFAGSKKTQPDSSRAAASDSRIELSGQELWSNNCQRCHNLQSPTMYSPAQWGIIAHHMRVRANITGAEQRAIVAFLKSSN